MRWEPMHTRSSRPSLPETSPAERVTADLHAIGACRAEAERVGDSVPLWFHTFALARGIYTPGIARDHGYRHAVLGADRFAGRSVLDVGAFDGFCSFLAALDACSSRQRAVRRLGPRSVRRDAPGRRRLSRGRNADGIASRVPTPGRTERPRAWRALRRRVVFRDPAPSYGPDRVAGGARERACAGRADRA
jgi:hypothetical protein